MAENLIDKSAYYVGYLSLMGRLFLIGPITSALKPLISYDVDIDAPDFCSANIFSSY